MENYVKDKVIIITGAGSGFGKSTALKASDMGGKVVCADINEGAIKALIGEIKEKGNQAEYVVTDVSDKEQVDAMAKFAVDQYGRIDVLVNNAGIMPVGFYADHEKSWQLWDKCIDICLKGVLYGICAVHDQMVKQGQGQIINLSSTYANAPVAGGGAYQAAKIGVRYLSEILRQESQGLIKVTTINPTGVPTTGLMGTVVNPASFKGLLGCNLEANIERRAKKDSGELSPDYDDVNSVKCWFLESEHVADNIIYCMDQPWGVSIGDMTVRSSGELFVL